MRRPAAGIPRPAFSFQSASGPADGSVVEVLDVVLVVGGVVPAGPGAGSGPGQTSGVGSFAQVRRIASASVVVTVNDEFTSQVQSSTHELRPVRLHFIFELNCLRTCVVVVVSAVTVGTLFTLLHIFWNWPQQSVKVWTYGLIQLFGLITASLRDQFAILQDKHCRHSVWLRSKALRRVIVRLGHSVMQRRELSETEACNLCTQPMQL